MKQTWDIFCFGQKQFSYKVKGLIYKEVFNKQYTLLQ